MNTLAIIAVCAAIIGLVVAVCLASWIRKSPEGNDRMKEISGFIAEGAMAFLKREYKIMAIVIVCLFLLIAIFISPVTGVLYVCGALLSVLAGFFGMKVATLGNVRT
ncbi:MAG: sodium/proton-translocating pyrophosphatase, partial [Firmicutes bacterium]|nr:sodium/proton-translocating pyrophosphatase [Bacillota bacterium]